MSVEVYNEILKAASSDTWLNEDDCCDALTVALLDDVTDRRGWRQEWDSFDLDVKAEIIESWRSIIIECLDEFSLEEAP